MKGGGLRVRKVGMIEEIRGSGDMAWASRALHLKRKGDSFLSLKTLHESMVVDHRRCIFLYLT
jgi:hypothetical protein